MVLIYSPEVDGAAAAAAAPPPARVNGAAAVAARTEASRSRFLMVYYMTNEHAYKQTSQARQPREKKVVKTR